jgi:hypothetical protein
MSSNLSDLLTLRFPAFGADHPMVSLSAAAVAMLVLEKPQAQCTGGAQHKDLPEVVLAPLLTGLAMVAPSGEEVSLYRGRSDLSANHDQYINAHGTSAPVSGVGEISAPGLWKVQLRQSAP